MSRDTELGFFELGLSLEEPSHDTLKVGLFLKAPKLGRWLLAMEHRPQGERIFSTVSREDTGTLSADEPAPPDAITHASRLKFQHDEMKHRALELEKRWAEKLREKEQKILALQAEVATLSHTVNEQNRQRHQLEEKLTSQIGELERALAIKEAMLNVFEKELAHKPTTSTPRSKFETPFEAVAASIEVPEEPFREYTLPYSLESLGPSRAATQPELEISPYSTPPSHVPTKS